MSAAETTVAPSSKKPPKVKSRRRWLQFSLRTLMIAMLVLSIGFGEIGRRIYQANDQAAKVAALRSLGVAVQYEIEFSNDESGKISNVSRQRSNLQRQIVTWLGNDFAFKVHGLKTTGPPPASTQERNAFWRIAASFPELCSLTAGPEWCDGSGLARLRGKTSMRSLSLYAREPTNEDLEVIGTLVNLQRLHFMAGGKRPSLMDDRGLVHLDRLEDLRDLALGEFGITDASLSHLSSHPRLTSLSLSSTAITDQGLTNLAGLSRLEHLNLSQTRVSDEGLRHLKPLRNLLTLSLHDTNVRGPGLEHLQSLPILKQLYLDTKFIDDDDLKHFEGLHDLLEIRLDESQITDAGLRRFHPPANAYSMSLFRTGVTDYGLISLARYPQIQVLNVTYTRVTPEGVAAFQKAAPRCQVK